MKNAWVSGAVLMALLAGCSEAADPSAEQAPAEQGGKAAGEVQGGSISDAMIPLESLQSQSPPLQPQTSTVTTTITTTDGDGTVQTSVTTTNVSPDGGASAPAPTPPEPPAAPGG